MHSKRLSAFAATILSVAAFAAFNPPQYTNTYTSGGVTYAQFGGVKSSNYVATAVSFSVASNYADAVASEFEDGTRTVSRAISASDASSAFSSYYLAGDSWSNQYNADDLIRASTNAALSVSGTLEWRLTNGYLKVASAENADTATSSDTAQNAANVAWDANGNYMSGSEIYARVIEDIPRPGNYAAVSNAAMNARSVTDLGVRGAPQWAGSWFVVDGVVCSYDVITGWINGWIGGRYRISHGGASYLLHIEDEPVAYFTLEADFTAMVDGHFVVGYVGTLAQVSQIPDVPRASDGLPHMDGTASAGTTNTFARGDHVHPSDAAKLDGAAAYPAWETREYGENIVVSHIGRLWKSLYDFNYGEPGYETTWQEVYLRDLKQSALPYPTNAIPYLAITGAPTPPSAFYDTSGGAASVSGATLTYQAASNSVGSVALLAGTNVLHITAPSAITGHVRDFGLTVTTEDAATITLDSSVSWRFDAANTNLAAGSWNRVYCTESPTGVFSLQLWTPDSSQEATP